MNEIEFETWMLLINKELLEQTDISVYDIEDDYPFHEWFYTYESVQDAVDFIMSDLLAFKDDWDD